MVENNPFRDDILINHIDENLEERNLEGDIRKTTGSDNSLKFNIFRRKKSKND
jgi:hypothetical protein